MSNKLFVDVHVIQTVPPSCLNRDDAGSPKQAVYGGARRARVSSQAWKRATRLAFREELAIPADQLGVRTKRISSLLADRLAARTGIDADAASRLSTALLQDLKVTDGKNAGETAYLLFFGLAQLDAIVDLVAGQAEELAGIAADALPKAVADLPVRETLAVGHPIDVALFGRMVADLSTLNVDAAAQVAHALSTHAAEIEFDYYTAVDDAPDPDREDAGASMIGTVEFTSATLYRYATVGLHTLRGNLGGDADAAADALSVFIRAFAKSMPTGHQNTFAHRTSPSLLCVMVRDDQPVNLVSAFEKPVSRRDGLVGESVSRLAAELTTVSSRWGCTPALVATAYDNPDNTQTLHEAFGPPRSLDEVVTAVDVDVRARLGEMTPR
ncbi:type I-E CRISPR-associated protein Cas7/Cse4/CasC [Micromonospora sp. LOL_023]|uniref:type I-E CRISPR-associated protein Cas7/Cse4/CasC n=1 Tax=Micromonospora sp. LOL_023 TaxID=3345418 RepID=UPI003A8BD66C